jgi:hypothetical protein
MVCRVEGSYFQNRLPGDGTTKTTFGDKAPKAANLTNY